MTETENKSPCKPVVILAEDDDGHAFLLRKELRRYNFPYKIIRFVNGLEVVDFLDNSAHPTSNFLFLVDLNMPRMDGFGLIKHLKSNETFSNWPVIVLTSSPNPDDIIKAHKMGVDDYFVKPVNYSDLIETIRKTCFLKDYSEGQT